MLFWLNYVFVFAVYLLCVDYIPNSPVVFLGNGMTHTCGSEELYLKDCIKWLLRELGKQMSAV